MNCWLECRSCHFRREIGPWDRACPECSQCGLEVRYRPDPFTARPLPGIWRWRDRLPPAGIVTLGEGNTPLIPVDLPDGSRLWLKNETMNPTWSYKDRFNAVTVAMGRQFGKRGIAATTTGNHGMSAAAYAASAGMECAIFCHPDASEAQVEMIRRYGATATRGGDRPAAMRALLASGEWHPSSSLSPSNGYANPYGIEGYKTVAFELVDQLGRAPDRVYVPLGGGDGLYGIWKGFRELFEAGAIDRLPRMIGGKVDPSSAALSIADATPGTHGASAIDESHGYSLELSDAQLTSAETWLARKGIGVEMSSAAPLAARMASSEAHEDSQIDVAVLTGAAIKWPEHLLHAASPVR